MTQKEKPLYYQLEDRFNQLADDLGIVDEGQPLLLIALSGISSGGRCENGTGAVDDDVRLITEGITGALRHGVSRNVLGQLVEMTIRNRHEMVKAGFGQPFTKDHIQRINASLKS